MSKLTVFLCKPRWLAISASAMSVLVVGATAAVLVEGRHEVIERARQSSANVVSAMAGDVARNLEVYNLALQAVQAIGRCSWLLSALRDMPTVVAISLLVMAGKSLS